jgi:cobalt-zinc-cadmium efflux system protein
MNHKHNSHNHKPHSSSVKNIQLAFIINLVFMVIEIVGGLLTNSIAVLSDAVP